MKKVFVSVPSEKELLSTTALAVKMLLDRFRSKPSSLINGCVNRLLDIALFNLRFANDLLSDEKA